MWGNKLSEKQGYVFADCKILYFFHQFCFLSIFISWNSVFFHFGWCFSIASSFAGAQQQIAWHVKVTLCVCCLTCHLRIFLPLKCCSLPLKTRIGQFPIENWNHKETLFLLNVTHLPSWKRNLKLTQDCWADEIYTRSIFELDPIFSCWFNFLKVLIHSEETRMSGGMFAFNHWLWSF